GAPRLDTSQAIAPMSRFRWESHVHYAAHDGCSRGCDRVRAYGWIRLAVAVVDHIARRGANTRLAVHRLAAHLRDVVAAPDPWGGDHDLGVVLSLGRMPA